MTDRLADIQARIDLAKSFSDFPSSWVIDMQWCVNRILRLEEALKDAEEAFGELNRAASISKSLAAEIVQKRTAVFATSIRKALEGK